MTAAESAIRDELRSLGDLPLISWLTSLPLISWLMLAHIVHYTTLLSGDIHSRWYWHLPLLTCLQRYPIYGAASYCPSAIGSF